MLQYSSAFDDEVVAVPGDAAAAELPDSPESVLECVLEEPPEAVMGAAPEPQPDEESPGSQAESGRPPTSVVHGPYYYFYQGESLPAVQLCSGASPAHQAAVRTLWDKPARTHKS